MPDYFVEFVSLTLSCPSTGRAIVKIGHSNLRPSSKELKRYFKMLQDPKEFVKVMNGYRRHNNTRVRDNTHYLSPLVQMQIPDEVSMWS